MEKELELKTSWGDMIKVQLEVNSYLNNGCLYIGLIADSEPYGDVTVNLPERAPDYCGYIDINNMPELEQFIQENDLAEFTGFMGFSGFCQYPLYLFNVDKLRELCPDGMAVYEKSIGIEEKVMEKTR